MKCKDMLSVPEGNTEWRGIQTQSDTFWAPKPGSRLKTAANLLHSDDTKQTSHLKRLLTAETKSLHPVYEKC